MFRLNFVKDGYIKASDLENILIPIADNLGGEFGQLKNSIDVLEKDYGERIKKLERELELERRLRLGRK